jgi:hypothetical protein
MAGLMEWEVVQNLGIFAGGTATVGLVARYGIARFSRLAERGIDRSSDALEQGIERFAEAVEQSVEQYIDGEIARHDAELRERRVVSSRVHEERAKIVVELYQRFVRFERDMRALATGGSGDAAADELRQTAAQSGTDFADYYAEHRIYFPPDACDAVERLQKEMNQVFVDMRAGTAHGDRPGQGADIDRWRSTWQDAAEDKVPELEAELEEHCRDLLGVDPN